MLFQGVSLPCFIQFHDHETRAVGTSLNARSVGDRSMAVGEMVGESVIGWVGVRAGGWAGG